jgi:seryl-tRNA synthetase
MELMRHPKALRARLKESQQELERRNAELQLRLDNIKRQQEKLSRKVAGLLEQYDPNDQRKHVKALLQQALDDAEQQFAEYEKETAQIEAQLQATTISDAYIDRLEQLAYRVEGKLENADFAQRRQLIEDLNLRGTLALEDGLKVLYLHLYTYTDRIPLETHSNPSCA